MLLVEVHYLRFLQFLRVEENVGFFQIRPVVDRHRFFQRGLGQERVLRCVVRSVT